MGIDMQAFGWTLFAAGAAVLFWTAFVGFDAGNSMRVTNLALLTVGSSAMISGSVLGAVGKLLDDTRSISELNMAQHSIRAIEEGRSTQSPEEVRPKEALANSDNPPIMVYRGKSIFQEGKQFRVGQSNHSSIEGAKEFIRLRT